MWKYFRHRLFSRLFTFVRRPSCSLCIKWQADKICSLFLQFVYPAVDCTTLLSPVLRQKLLHFSLIKEKINRYSKYRRKNANSMSSQLSSVNYYNLCFVHPRRIPGGSSDQCMSHNSPGVYNSHIYHCG